MQHTEYLLKPFSFQQLQTLNLAFIECFTLSQDNAKRQPVSVLLGFVHDWVCLRIYPLYNIELLYIASSSVLLTCSYALHENEEVHIGL